MFKMHKSAMTLKSLVQTALAHLGMESKSILKVSSSIWYQMPGAYLRWGLCGLDLFL